MLNRILTMAIGAVLGQEIKKQVRKGSIHAVKNYIQVVKLARMATLGLVGLSVAAAILVAGILLVVVGVVGLLPIDPNTVAIVLISIGALLALLAGLGFTFAFKESRWLEVSKAYELMDAALNVDAILPPNPLEILMREHAAVAPVENQPAAPPLESRLMPLDETAETKTETPTAIPVAKTSSKTVAERSKREIYPTDYSSAELIPV